MHSWELKRRAYSADFGAGNTLLYVTTPGARAEKPTHLNDVNGEPSGYALFKDGEVRLGHELMGIPYSDLNYIEKFRINLKAVPSRATRDELVYYFRSWLERIKTFHAQEFEGVEKIYWFIGCPTNDDWRSPEVQKLYKEIFEEAGFASENVYLVLESNAAIAYFEQINDILTDVRRNHGRLLLLDQGAYSLDGTFFRIVHHEDEKPFDSYGSCLGAGLIERMILHEILYKPEEEIRIGKKMINDPDTIKTVRMRYEQEGSSSKFVTYLLLKARELKEDYFTRESGKKLLSSKDLLCLTEYVDEDGGDLTLFTNSIMMHSILEELPICEVLGSNFNELPDEVKKELSNRSWMGVFRAYLDRLSEHFGGFGNGENTQIMLTGGGSLMKCVSEAVKKRFPSANVYGDTNGLCAIGEGMAYWSHDKIKALDFTEAFEEFTNRTQKESDGSETNIISANLSIALGECLKEMVEELIAEEAEAFWDGVKDWAIYNCASYDIPARMKTHIQNWCNSKGMPNFSANIDRHIEKIKEGLNSDFITYVLKPLKMPADEPLLSPSDKVFLSMSRQGMQILFNAMTEVIVSHYQGHQLWGYFPNDSEGFFSDPRMQWLKNNADALDEWMNKETDATIQIVSQVFSEYEYDLVADRKLTFLMLFLLEGHSDLVTLMQKRVKKILGSLVLEESIDDE